MNQDQQAARELADELLADIELSRLGVDQLILKSARLARLVDDHEVIQWLLWERSRFPDNESAQAWQHKTSRRYSDGDHVAMGVTQIVPMLATLHEELKQLRLPELSGEYIVVATNNIMHRIGTTRNNIVKYEIIVAAVTGELHSFVTRTFYALKISERQDSIFAKSTAQIEHLLSSLGVDTVRKMDAAYKNLQEGDKESTASAMLSVRRLIDGFADAVFPATEIKRFDGQGNAISLGQQQRLNRVKAHIDDKSLSKSRADRLKRAVSDIYGRVSTGVHAEVSAGEAEFLFLSTYTILGEILSLDDEGEDVVIADVAID